MPRQPPLERAGARWFIALPTSRCISIRQCSSRPLPHLVGRGRPMRRRLPPIICSGAPVVEGVSRDFRPIMEFLIDRRAICGPRWIPVYGIRWSRITEARQGGIDTPIASLPRAVCPREPRALGREEREIDDVYTIRSARGLSPKDRVCLGRVGHRDRQRRTKADAVFLPSILTYRPTRRSSRPLIVVSTKNRVQGGFLSACCFSRMPE